MSEVLNGVLVVTYDTTDASGAAEQWKIEDFYKLPVASQLALASKGFAHTMGNESASAVVGKIKAAVRAAAGDPKMVVERTDVQAFRQANADLVAEWTKAEKAEAFAQILSGEVSARATGPRGPKLDEFAAMVRTLAENAIAEVLAKDKRESGGGAPVLERNKAGKWTLVGGKAYTGKDVMIRYADGTTATMPQLIDRRLANPERRAQHEAAARKLLDAAKRENAKASADESLD